MRITKRLLAVLLSLLLACTSVPLTAFGATVTVEQLQTKITEYETKLSNATTLRKNLAPAYEQYLKAKECIDAVTYGLKPASELSTQMQSVYNDFSAAISALDTEWTAPTATVVPKFPNDGSGTIGSSYYGNILYWGSLNNTLDDSSACIPWGSFNGKSSNLQKANYWLYLHYPTTVLLNGTTTSTLRLPIMLAQKDTSSGIWHTKYLNSFYIGDTSGNNVNTQFTMGGYWKGYHDAAGTLNWPTTYSQNNNLAVTNPNNDDPESNRLQASTSGSTAANYITWVRSSADTTNYYNDYQLQWYFQLRWQTYDSWRYHWYTDKCYGTANNHIYVINYAPLYTKINNNKSAYIGLMQNATKYDKYANKYLAEMKFIDDMTSVNINSYDFSSDTATKVKNAGTAIKNAMTVESSKGEAEYTITNTQSPTAAQIPNAAAIKTAYANAVWYDDLRTALTTANAIPASDENLYTTSSWTAFTNKRIEARNAMIATLDNNYSVDVTELANSLGNILDLRADFTAIDADNAVSIVATDYTYDSYKAFRLAKQTVDAYHAYDATARADVGKKANESKVDQSELDAADTAFDTAYAALAPVDAADKYTTFDAVVATVQSELNQTGKYSAAAINSISNLLAAQQAAVYHTVTADEAGLLGVAAGTVLKNTTTDATDTVTANLLTAVNTITQNTQNYNNYTVTFTAEKDDIQIINQTATVTYGTVYTFDLGSNFDEDNNTVIWSATTNDGTSTTGSNKMNGRGSIDKLIDTNIAVHAKITSGDAQGDLYTYKIYNGNGRLVAIEHHETKDVKQFTDAEALVAIPFYTFDSWYIEVDENTKTVTVKAAYKAGDPIHYSVVSGTLTNDKGEDKGVAADLVYDRETKVTYTGSNTFYAWAVKVGSKYTVVSYHSEYTFYSHTALDFVPIIKDGDTYKLETAEGNIAVTADMIASEPVNTFGMTADEYVKKKLDLKAPFIAVVGTKILDNAKTRAFAMVTEGCTTAYSGVGMKFSKEGVDPLNIDAKPIPTVVSTGQFSVTLSGTTIGKFRATVNYDFPYSQAGGTAHLDVTDVSDLA